MTLLADLVATSQRVGATPARSAKVRELADLLRRLPPEEIALGVHYLSGDIPQGRFGIGYAALQAVSAGAAQAAPVLTLADLDRCLTEIAGMRGAGSTGRRAAALRTLFVQATLPEREFLIRLLTGELRQGALAGIMLDAIAAAADIPAAQLRRAAMYAPLGAIAQTALVEGVTALGVYQLETLSPIAPMLAQSAADVAQALEQLRGTAVFEWKMDGARVQVHKSGDTVRVYTRNLNEVSVAVPEVVELARALATRDVILDGEVLAFTAAGRPQPFQVTMRRFGRKLDVERLRSELPLQAFFFDCLRYDGRTLTDRPTHERCAALAQALPAALLIPRLITSSVEQARGFYATALAAGHEGVMAKSLDAPYEAGNRGAGWLKIKRAHTLDLLVLAAEWGHGRRTGKLSNLHLGARDPASGEYIMLGKTFKGLTDELLEWQTQELLARETHREPGVVYVRPELVVEIAFSDLQSSPRYPGRLALRLARVKRYRSDKRAADADTMQSVRQLYAAQSGGAEP
jgi:DNA ligase-1